MREYRILWLDDDFLPLISNPSEDQESINDTRETFQQDIRMLCNEGFIVDPVSNYKQFCERLKDGGPYNAVILDLMGLDNENIDNYFVAGDALDAAKQLNLPVYVYSSNVSEDNDAPGDLNGNPAVLRYEGIIRHVKKSGRAFYKGLGVERLQKKLKEELDKEHDCFVGHEECLSLLNKGYLNKELIKEMTNIMKSCKDHEDCSLPPLNDMRKILENMVEILLQQGEIQKCKKGSLKDEIYYLSEFCEKDQNGKIDSKKPYFPYSKCGQEIKLVLSFLERMTQDQSHFVSSKNEKAEYLTDGETILVYRKLIKECVSSAFFIAMKWYYGFMEHFHPCKMGTI